MSIEDGESRFLFYKKSVTGSTTYGPFKGPKLLLLYII